MRLAGTKLSRMGMDMERSTASTVAERLSASTSTTSKSSGVRRTGTPEPPRRTALCTVVERCRFSGSPYSYALVVSSRSCPVPVRSAEWSPMRSLLIWPNRSASAFWPSRRTPSGVSSIRPPCCSMSPASASDLVRLASRSSARAASSPMWFLTWSRSISPSAAGVEADCSMSSMRSSWPSWVARSVASVQAHGSFALKL